MTAKSLRTTRGPTITARCSERRHNARGDRAREDGGPLPGSPRPDGPAAGEPGGGRGVDGPVTRRPGAGAPGARPGAADDSFPTFHTPVRGYRFAARPPGAGHPCPGQTAGLRREDGHPVDPWAVAVWVRAEDGAPWRIGYLERAVAARLAPRLDGGLGVSATVAGWAPEPDGGWRRPIVRVEPDGYHGREPGERGRAPPLRRAQPR